MTCTKFNTAILINVPMLLATGATVVLLSRDAAAEDLSPVEILKKTQANYASLASYSDEGKVIKTISSDTITTKFTIRLARTNFYRIEWTRDSESSRATMYNGPQAAWSSGAGDFLNVGYGPRNQPVRDIALAEASAYSGGATATIPVTFFNLQPDDALDGLALGENQQADEKLGDVDCYVFAKELLGQKSTLWIGKQDFLIHQFRTETGAEAMQVRLAAAMVEPDLIDRLQKSGNLAFTSIETHTNIVLNKKFVPSDFVPSFPTFSSFDSE